MTEDNKLEFFKYFLNETLYHIEEPDSSSKEAGAPLGDDIDSSVTKVGSPILIIFEYADELVLPLHLKEYLTKILSAVNLSMDDVDIENFRSVESVIDYEKVICFTRNCKIAPHQETYKLQKEGGTQWLITDILSTIQASTNLRKNLWEALQAMFL